jgi:hypothetical protein
LAERPQFHGTVGERAETKRDVDAFRDEVDAFVGEAEIDADVAIAVLKREDKPADMKHPNGCGAGEPDRARRRCARAANLIARLFDKAQDLHAVRIIAAALIGHRDTPGGPAEQGDPDGVLQFPQMARDCRLADPEFSRDRRQTASFSNAHEGAHALERDS